MALEDFTSKDSPLESFEIRSQQILVRELLGEMPAAAQTNGEASLTEDFIEISAAGTQSLFGGTAHDTALSGYDLPVEAQSNHRAARPANEQLSSNEIRHLLQKLQEFKQLQELSALMDQAKSTGVQSPVPAQAHDVAAVRPAAATPAQAGAGGDSMKQMSQMMQSAAPMMESLAPVMQEVLPQLIEQVGPMMEELLPMITEAAGSVASAI